nr:L,D-transpeptidase family protein [uncultured Caldimonas sp.]
MQRRHLLAAAALTFVAFPSVAGPRYTVADRLRQFQLPVQERLAPAFKAAGLSYPPAEVAYVAFKTSRRLELYARASASSPWVFVKPYRVQAASGTPGPKLREGDYQVPEGLYRVTFLNANSAYHLSLRLDYPNAFDRRMAAADGRRQLGGDIMIHGKAVSIGCLAMGDAAAEELFVLAALVTPAKVRVLIAPADFRADNPAPRIEGLPPWTGELYGQIRRELAQFPAPRQP